MTLVLKGIFRCPPTGALRIKNVDKRIAVVIHTIAALRHRRRRTNCRLGCSAILAIGIKVIDKRISIVIDAVTTRINRG